MSVHHVYNQTWNESTITWNDQPCGGIDDNLNSTNCNITSEDSYTGNSNTTIIFDVTDAVKTTYTDGNSNITLLLKHTNESGTSSSTTTMASKEHTASGYRPYLNITYQNLPPTWSNNVTLVSSPATYSAGASYGFNVTWSDAEGYVNTAKIVHNFTGSATPHNASFTGNSSGVYYFSVSDLPAGNYIWRSFASDDSGGENVTNSGSYWIYTVSGLSNPVSVKINNSLNQNVSMTYPAGSNITGFCGGAPNCYIYINGTQVDAQNNTNLGRTAGLYMVSVNTSDSQNYTAYSRSYNLTIAQASNPTTLKINGLSNQNVNVTYPTESNITGLCGVASGCHIYINNTEVDVQNNTNIGRGAGLYMIKVNITDYTNYSLPFKQYNLTVSQGSNPTNLYINSNLNQNVSIIFPTQSNITGLCGGSPDCHIFINGTKVDAQNNSLVTRGAGLYRVKVNTSDYVNYSTYAKEYNLTVTPENTSVNLIYNFTSPIEKGAGMNFTIWASNTTLSSYLYSNFTGSLNLETASTGNWSYIRSTSNLTLGTYQIKVNVTGDANHSSNSTGLTYNFIIQDTKPPTYSGFTNTSVPDANDDFQILVYWVDIDGVSSVKFSHNATGSWGNYSYATNSTNTYDFTILSGNFSAGESVGYKVYSNDSTGNENVTILKEFVVTSILANITATEKFGSINIGENNTLYCRYWEFGASNITDATVKVELNSTNYVMIWNSTSGYYEYTYNTTGESVGSRSWTCYANRTDYESKSTTSSFTLTLEAPQIFNLVESPSSPSTYSSMQIYNFTADATGDVSKVFLDWNYTDNILASVLTGNTYKASKTDLPAGSYSFRWLVNNSSNAWTATNYKTYQVSISNPISGMNITKNTTSWSILYPLVTNVSASETNAGDSDCLYNFSVNGVYLSNYYETALKTPGTYNYSLNVSATCSNYTTGQVNATLTVIHGSTNTSFYLNGTQADRNYNKSEVINATAVTNVTGLNVSIYHNNSGSYQLFGRGATNNTTFINTSDWSLGTYRFLANTTGNNTFGNSSVTYDVRLVDNIKPQVTGKNLSSTSAYVSGSLTIYANATDNDAISQVWCQVKNPSAERTNYSMNFDEGTRYLKLFSNTTTTGVYVVEFVYVNDSSGNLISNSTSLNFSISNAPSDDSGGVSPPTKVPKTKLENFTITHPSTYAFHWILSPGTTFSQEYIEIENPNMQDIAVTLKPKQEIDESYQWITFDGEQELKISVPKQELGTNGKTKVKLNVIIPEGTPNQPTGKNLYDFYIIADSTDTLQSENIYVTIRMSKILGLWFRVIGVYSNSGAMKISTIFLGATVLVVGILFAYTHFITEGGTKNYKYQKR